MKLFNAASNLQSNLKFEEEEGMRIGRGKKNKTMNMKNLVEFQIKNLFSQLYRIIKKYINLTF
ncbi:hypothetical protein BpHYR1_013445 [Brachionus plicatilis]|uniref:Uncharacterized protein n=1 Tax=Brachionus plicatilis TaxID=10195 RepID=A0A3M7P354_BRAPC|nr:hypothetical protein BpHYR1_013445 [Brachionus plicatilis]